MRRRNRPSKQCALDDRHERCRLAGVADRTYVGRLGCKCGTLRQAPANLRPDTREGISMSTRIRAHLRGNVVGYIALFLVIPRRTASALNGSNTVFRDDIVNGDV